MEKLKAYVASPLGFSQSGRLYLRTQLYPVLERIGLSVLDPWKWQVGTDEKAIIKMTAKGASREIALKIGRANMRLIDESNLLVAILDGQDIDSGVSSEIAHASLKAKPVFGLKTDFRFSGDSDLGVNLQVYTYIIESGGNLYRTEEAMLKVLRKHLAKS